VTRASLLTWTIIWLSFFFIPKLLLLLRWSQIEVIDDVCNICYSCTSLTRLLLRGLIRFGRLPIGFVNIRLIGCSSI
jgi:hypothetical protein